MFKYKKDRDLIFRLHPTAFKILGEMREFCFFKDIPFLITATVTTKLDDLAVGRKSSTHRTCRAFDLSVRSWDDSDIKDFCIHFEEKFKEVAAVTSKGFAQLIPPINHGTAKHIHVQINARFALNEFIDL